MPLNLEAALQDAQTGATVYVEERLELVRAGLLTIAAELDRAVAAEGDSASGLHLAAESALERLRAQAVLIEETRALVGEHLFRPDPA